MDGPLRGGARQGQRPAPLDPKEIARYLQFELKRVGCFDGAVNGQFTEPTFNGRQFWE